MQLRNLHRLLPINIQIIDHYLTFFSRIVCLTFLDSSRTRERRGREPFGSESSSRLLGQLEDALEVRVTREQPAQPHKRRPPQARPCSPPTMVKHWSNVGQRVLLIVDGGGCRQEGRQQGLASPDIRLKEFSSTRMMLTPLEEREREREREIEGGREIEGEREHY